MVLALNFQWSLSHSSRWFVHWALCLVLRRDKYLKNAHTPTKLPGCQTPRAPQISSSNDERSPWSVACTPSDYVQLRPVTGTLPVPSSWLGGSGLWVGREPCSFPWIGPAMALPCARHSHSRAQRTHALQRTSLVRRTTTRGGGGGGAHLVLYRHLAEHGLLVLFSVCLEPFDYT